MSSGRSVWAILGDRLAEIKAARAELEAQENEPGTTLRFDAHDQATLVEESPREDAPPMLDPSWTPAKGYAHAHEILKGLE